MKRRLLIGLFTFGTIAGFGSGIASMAWWHGHHAHQRRAALEAHVADLCVGAARRAQADERAGHPPPERRRARRHWRRAGAR